MSPRAALFVGHHQVGSSEPSRLVIVADQPGPLEISLTRDDKAAVRRTLSAARAPRDLVEALAEHTLYVFHARLPAPARDAADRIELRDAAGALLLTRALQPVPATLEDGLTLIVGSCLYGFHPERTASLARALEGEAGRGARMALLLGDSVYLDVHPRRLSLSATERAAARHTAAIYAQSLWRDDGARRALSALPLRLSFDDHELWDGWPEPQPHVARTWLPHVRGAFDRAAHDALALLFDPLAPTALVAGSRSTMLELGGLSLFQLDLRTARTRLEEADPRLTSEAELECFERWAAALTGPGVLALQQPLLIEPGPDHEPNAPRFARHYDRILRALRDAPWDILIVAGDLHWSHVLELSIDGRTIHEVVSSPLVRIPSFARSILGRLGVPEDQERERVRIPAAPPRPPYGVPIDARNYRMGTACANGYARLRFEPRDAGRVACKVELVDHARTAPDGSPALARCEVDSGRGLPSLVPPGAACATEIVLGRAP